MRIVRTFVVAAMATVLTACVQGSVFVVTLAPSTLEVVRGGVGTVAVTVGGAGGDIVLLGVSGLPAGVTASFEPPSLSGGATASTLTIAVAPGAAEVDATVTVTATRGGSAATAELELSVVSLTVSGTVVDILGAGLSGVGVAIGGVATATNASGAFTIADVAVPYDLVVYRTGADAYAHVFQGLTRGDPVLLPYSAFSMADPPSGTVEGTLPAAVPVGSIARVCVEGIDRRAHGCDVVSAGDDAYEVTTWWSGAGTIDVRVHALLSTVDGDGVPTGHTAYGSAVGVATAGGATVVPIAATTAVGSTTTVGGSLTVPAGYQLAALVVGTELAGGYLLPVVSDSVHASNSFTATVPVLGGDRYAVVAQATHADGSFTLGWLHDVAGGGDASIALPAPPMPVAPADGATGVGFGTTFAIAPSSPAINTFIFQTSGGLEVAITTAADSVALPDLVPLGLTLPSLATYDWTPVESPGVTDIDGAGEAWLRGYLDAVLSLSAGGPTLSGDGSITQGPSRVFTTP